MGLYYFPAVWESVEHFVSEYCDLPCTKSWSHWSCPLLMVLCFSHQCYTQLWGEPDMQRRKKICFILLWHLFIGLWCSILTSSDGNICAGSRGSPSALLLQVMRNQFLWVCSVCVVQPNPQDPFCNTRTPILCVTLPKGLTPDRCIRKTQLRWEICLSTFQDQGWIWGSPLWSCWATQQLWWLLFSLKKFS